MGEIILNGKSYNSGMKYKEVTQAEYNALPSSKLTDGTLYCITDAPGPGEGFPPLIYSSEEREVGVWRDGKPIYQKTVKVTTTLVSGDVDVPISTPNLETLVDAWSTAKMGNGCWVQISTSNPTANWNLSIYDIDSTKVRFCVGSLIANRGFSEVYVTLQYTKTTDAAGSGIWTTDGIPTVHYSTNEKVIGTWTDGKPLYEMTIIKSRVGSPAASRDYVNVEDLSSANIDKLIRAEGSWFDGGVMRKAFPWADSGASLNICYNQNTKYLQILFYGFTGYDIYDVYMIIQYTKTTD